jgi:mono/diheme cytochrome c family protein
MLAKISPFLALVTLTACANAPEPPASSASAVATPAAVAAPAPVAPPVAAAPTPAPAPAVAAAKAAPGAEMFLQICSSCHAPEIVADKRLDRSGWDDVVHTMIGRGAAATEAEAQQIIDYLAATYPAR